MILGLLTVYYFGWMRMICEEDLIDLVLWIGGRVRRNDDVVD